MAKTVKLPGIGEVPQWTLFAGAAAVVGLIVIYSRKQKAAAAAAATTSAATVTDPAGNVCSVLDPASGYCPGTPEDSAYQQEASAGYTQAGYSGIGGYSNLISDSNGNQCVALDPATGLCPVASATSGVTTNTEWVTAAENQLGLTSTVQAALGYALSGQPVTPAQASLFNEAVGLLGPPPQGYPPLNVQGSAGQTTGSATTVPNVVGESTSTAVAQLTAAGFSPNPTGTGTVVSQTPAAGTAASPGSRVDIGSAVKVPNVVGMPTAGAETVLQNAGFVVSPSGTGKVFSQTPSAGSQASSGSRVDIGSR